MSKPPAEPRASGLRARRPATEGIGQRGAQNLMKMVGGHLVIVLVVTSTGLVVPRVMGVAGYGTFAAIMAVIAILHAVSSAGLHMVETRFLAPLWRSGEISAAEQLASSIWTVRALLAVVLAAAAGAWLTRNPSLGLDPVIPILAAILCLLRCLLSANRSLFLPLGHAGTTIGLEAARVTLALPIIVLCYLSTGLMAVLVGLPIVYGVLLLLGVARLRQVLRVRLSISSLASLRPHLGFGAATLIANLATTAHTHLAVWAVATWVVAEEAAFLAVAMHPFTLGAGLYYAARRSLLPLLAELESEADDSRLLGWGGLILRYSSAAAAALALAWAVLGRELILLALTPAFEPVYPAAAAMLVCLALFCWGATCNGLLFIRRKAAIGSFNHVVFTLLNLGGITIAVLGAGSSPVTDGEAALRITMAYAAASAFYAASAYLSLGLGGRLWLPAGKALLLMTPLLAVWPLVTRSSELGALPAKALGLIMICALWAAAAIRLRLIPLEELARLLQAARGSSHGPPRLPGEHP